jgi:serpin B
MLNRLFAALPVALGLAALCPMAVAQPKTPTAADPPPSKETAAQVRGNTVFALALYDQVRREPSNVIFSPYSLSAALAMTYDGARDETARQMANVLRFPLDRKKLHPAFLDLNARLTKRSDGLELSIANALWGQAGYRFEAEFLEATRQFYGAGLERVDFANPAAVKTINAWVNRETRAKIPDILQSGDVDLDTRLVLTNAIYLKGRWADPFPKTATKDVEFRRVAGDPVRVAMMHHTKRTFPYASVDGVEILELPYGGDKASMVLVLPDSPSDLADMEKSLSAEKLAAWTARLKQRLVDVSLPRFKIEQELRLKDTLKTMGMRSAFERADFSGISTLEPLQIQSVIHKALVEVDEEGTVAAAATAVGIRATSFTPPVHFKADRPFLFLIRDRATDSILFIGRVIDPTRPNSKG